MSKVKEDRSEPEVLDLAVSGAKEVVWNYGIGQEKLNQASFTIVSKGLDAADTTVELQASNTKDEGFLTIVDNAGTPISITLPSGGDENAVFLPEVGFSYLKAVVTRNSSTVGTVTITGR